MLTPCTNSRLSPVVVNHHPFAHEETRNHYYTRFTYLDYLNLDASFLFADDSFTLVVIQDPQYVEPEPEEENEAGLADGEETQE